MHDGQGSPGHIFNFCLLILILFSVSLIPLESLPTLSRYRDTILLFEAIAVSLFTVEYLLRLYAAPQRLRYLFSFFGIVDLLSIMPFYVGIFGTEYIRVLRLIRLMKVMEIQAAAQKDDHEVMQHDIGLLEHESVEYVVTKSPWLLLFGSIVPLLCFTFALGIFVAFEGEIAALSTGITLMIFGFIFIWKTWLDFSYDVIYITNVRLIFQNQHIFGRSINQVSYPSITNVKPFYPHLFSYMLRYGSLVIDTAAEHPGQIGLHGVRQHEHAAHLIMQKCYESQQRATPQSSMAA